MRLTFSEEVKIHQENAHTQTKIFELDTRRLVEKFDL